MISLAETLAAYTYDDPETLDWSAVHPDHVARLKAIGPTSQDVVDDYAAAFPAPGNVSVPSGGGRRTVFDLGPIVAASEAVLETVARVAEASEAAKVAKADLARARMLRAPMVAQRDALIRDAYAAGVTAGGLVGPTGLSLARVHQIVAGARG